MSFHIWRTLMAGVISTLSMDVLSVIASRVGLTAPLSPNLIGRWFVSVARAHPFHADIARATPASYEVAVALPVHYVIGAALTALYLLAAHQLGWPASSLPWVFTYEPIVLAWMPAAAVYFLDPDGHLLEYIAMLEGEPRPDKGLVEWRAWQEA